VSGLVGIETGLDCGLDCNPEPHPPLLCPQPQGQPQFGEAMKVLRVSSFRTKNISQCFADPFMNLTPKCVDVASEAKISLVKGGKQIFHSTLRIDESSDEIVMVEQLRSSPTCEKTFCAEVYLLTKLNHPNVVQVLGACLEPARIIIQNVDNLQTLKDCIGKLDDPSRSCLELIDGVSYLHQRGIVHGDIRPENIYVSNSGHLILANFGISNLGEYGDYAWSAPLDHEYTSAADIYSCGLLLRYICANDCSTTFDNLIKQCLDQDPLSRPLASDLSHS
jgi:serine/threonine protein kinase